MKELIILKDLAYIKAGGGSVTGLGDVSTMDAGALAVFDDENVLVPKTTPNLADKAGIYFAVGQDSTLNQIGVKTTSVIPRRGNVRVEKKAYSAPTKEIQFVGAEDVAGNSPVGALNVPSTLVADSTCYINIKDVSDPFNPISRMQNTEYKVVAGETQTTLLTNLIAKINLNAGKFVTASIIDTNKGIKLTADDYNVKSSVSVGGILEGSTIVNIYKYPTNNDVVAMYAGYGTSTQIAAMEAAFSGYVGNTNKVHMPGTWFTNGSSVVSGATYTTYAISWNTLSERTFGQKVTNKQELVIAVPSGAATLITDIETILTEAFGAIQDVESGT